MSEKRISEQELNELNKGKISCIVADELLDCHCVEQAERIKELGKIINEVNSWAVCSAIATPEDMMQNIKHIAKITNIIK
ncbi:MAG TPA: hypothetical protein ENH49_03670 [Candidatus Marinimicrobia bacterium]|nr:hypothetical protein [Candidatus Neomarinimicrobiota bacterium]